MDYHIKHVTDVNVVRAGEGDDEVGLSSQLLAADSGRRLHRLLALGGVDRAVGLDNLAHSSIVPLLRGTMLLCARLSQRRC